MSATEKKRSGQEVKVKQRKESQPMFVRLISHQAAVLFYQNKPATINQPAVLFSQNKSALPISHQPNENSANQKKEPGKGI
jgi:hypothetical protein